MSERLELPRVQELSAELGTTPLALTCDPDFRARAAGCTVEWLEDQARLVVGRRTAENARRVGTVSVIWPAPPGTKFSVVLDAAVTEPPAIDQEAAGEQTAGSILWVEVTSALLHVVKPVTGGR